jgi:ADP-dependent NAD(P)H-hydrate dehydratase / NAD(P)H-hydrate epimerase
MIPPMRELPHALYRAQDLRELDRVASAELGIPGYTLMTRAGTAAFRLLRRSWPRARNVLVVCAIGNNGGDGFVLARLARESGAQVEVLLLGEAALLRGDARRACEAMLKAGVQVSPFAAERWPDADVVVDAIFGTGLDREVGGVHREAITLVNRQHAPVLSLDIPSGLHADSGNALGVAVRATKTLSFIGLKQGLFTGQGPDYGGEIYFDDLGMPEEVYQRVPAPAFRISSEWMKTLLPPRARIAHKGHHGHVLVVGGEQGMAGAVRLAGEAAARVGAGLVSLATHPFHAGALNAARPELMCHAVPDANALPALLSKASVLAIGPGLGGEEWGRKLFGAVLESALPLVVDADALNWLAREPLRRNHWILTPHPGEAARLLNVSAGDVQADRWQAVRELHKRYGGVVILKGAGTLVCNGHDPVALCDTGNPGMAAGGMGDVLTGVIAGLLAQGLNPWQAALAGVHLHGRAGDIAAARDGERGMMAGDLMGPLHRLVNPPAHS